MTEQDLKSKIRTVGDGSGICEEDMIYPEELALAFRNRGMPIEGLRYPVTPTGMHYLLTHFDIPYLEVLRWASAVAEDGSFKSVEELRSIYGGNGIDGTKPTIAYCRIGERSSHTWFALTQLLGLDNVRNYDGSWTEYGSIVRAPIER